MLRAVFLLLLASPVAAQQMNVPTWDWQLTEPFDLSRDVMVMDLDPQNHEQSEIDAVKARGVTLICYLSVGTWENWRPLAVPETVLGKTPENWPEERYLDIRRHDVLLPLMTERFQACKDAGFDAVEPDNMDVYTNDSGFPLTAEDAADYASLLAARAHAMGLQIAQKNAPELAPRLAPVMDFAILESCFEYGWCGAFQPYADAGKPIFAAEYRAPDATSCTQATDYGISLIFKDTDLTRQFATCEDVK